MNQWISVDIALPPARECAGSEEVLILVKDEEGDSEIYKGFYEDGEWWTQWCHGCGRLSETSSIPVNVTHWMPLPSKIIIH